MGTNIGPKIGIQGEAEYRKELKNIQTGLKTLASEMKVVTSEFVDNEKSVDGLTKKNDVLQRTVYSLTERLELQKKMLAESAAAYGEADERTQKWQQVVNETTAELNKANAQIKKNEESIKELSEAEDGAGESTGKATEAIELLKDGLESKLGSALGLSKEQLGELGNSLAGSGALSVATAAAAAVGAIALLAEGIKKYIDFCKEAAQEGAAYADNILTISNNYGIATDKLQEYQYMSELVDTSLSTITGSMSKLTKNMASARNGNDELNKAFTTLGVRVTDGNGKLRDADSVFTEVIDHLGYMEDGAERDALAMTIFGKSAQELNSLIAAGADGIAGYAQEAHNMGYVLSDEALASLLQMDDQFQRFDRQMEAVKNQVAVELAPAIIDLTQQFLDFAQSIDWREFGKAAASAIKTVTPLLIGLAESIAGIVLVIKEIVEWAAKAAEAIASLFGGSKKSGHNGGFNGATVGTVKRNTSNYVSSGVGYTSMADVIKQGGYTPATQSNNTTVNVQFTGDLAQLGSVLQPVVTAETERRGRSAVR